jgi:hypothetical protein
MESWRGITGNVRRILRLAGTILLPIMLSTLFTSISFAEPSEDWKKEVDLLREQNRLLQQQVKMQQQTIDKVNERMGDLERKLQDRGNVGESDEPKKKGFSLKNVVIGGEGGVAFFSGQSESQFPHSTFRIDEARLFVESPIIENVYFYSELNLTTREAYDDTFRLGELYLDFENLSRFWNQDNQLTLRVGRFYTPFGEEYQYRYAINNPLIFHSLSDIWGVDEGAEIFGTLDKFSYAFAVQNGGIGMLNDDTGDKSVAGRIGFDPTHDLHLSASAMMTGDITSTEYWSALWFGNGYFQPLTPQSPATKFHANLFEGDVRYKWKTGHVHGAGGYAFWGDDDHNHRDIYYYYVEAMQELPKKFYAAARFSQILAVHGYPLIGNGNYSYSDELTRNLWRLSLGVGWRYNQHLVLKADYSFERGREQEGVARHHEDMFGAEAAFQF